ncbi:trichohyalin [Archocentrus centrarchus]|uniref:trichohyalin n=1 Tax=Archocentrus centrarchus TaxID=63155 RepID=UPI0011E9B673|nr:trichohyalin-like [Archocentrus centrarchus]
MGTKRPSWTLFDTLINMSMSDHKLQPGGKVSRDPSPRPAMTVRSEQERDGPREENWRKENEADKMRDKTRYRDMDAPDRCEGDRSPGPRSREGEREMWERDRRKEDGRSRNGKLLLNVEKETQELERRAKKGGTFPRFKNAVTSPDRRLMSVTEIGEERGKRRQKDRTKRAETDAWEQERERAWQRERERDEVISRVKEEGKTTGRRYMEHEKVQPRERYQESDIRFQDSRREVADSWVRREQMREKPMLDTGEREVRMAFLHRRKDIKNYGDRKESENAQRREKRRDIRSEGDDERELRRERMRDRDGEELMCQYSRSEGDNKMARERDRERQRYRARDREREVDRSRGERAEEDHEQYRDGDRRAARPADREGKESWRDLDNRDDRKENEQYREYTYGRNGKRKEKQADTQRVDRTDRISRSPTEQAPRVPPRAQSSGEWSSNPDSEMRYRRDRGRYEDQESRREGMFEREREREREIPRDPEQTADKRQIRNERQESDKGEKTGSMPEQRRMWLEPQRGKNSKGKFIDGERHTGWKEEEETSMELQAERGRDGWRIKKEPDERCLEQSSYKQSQGGRNEYREDTEGEREGVSVDEEKVGEIWRDKGEKEHLPDSDGGIEESSQRDEGEDVIDDIEKNDREEESGSDYWARYESEGGSEAGWKKERDKMLAPENGIVTVSSGGENEREDTEEEFRDCQEFQEGGAQSPAGFKGYERDQKREEERTTGDEETADGEEKQPKYVFVVGKTLPQSQNSKISPWQADQIEEVKRNDPNLETDHHLSCNATQQPQDDLHQTLNRNDEHPVINNQDTESEHKVQREERLSTGQEAEGNIQSTAPSDIHDTESSEEMRSKVRNLYYGLGIAKRDSKTERLLKEWREKNKELTGKGGIQASFSQSDLDRLQPILDQINTGALSPEEVEAIRIRLSGTWSMSEEPKRRSQAPHLRWAKDVVREILGHSEEEPSTEALDNQPVANQSEISNTKEQEEVAEETREVPVIKLSTDEEDLEPELEELFDVRDDEDDRSKSWGEVGLRILLGTIEKRRKNSKFFSAAQLYQQYSEAAQNFEILRQARSETLSVCEDTTSSPLPSPPPARRPLPPVPPPIHPSLPLPERPRGERRASSPRLSIAQSSSLWRDLPGVRDNAELEELTDDQRRLQEVRFEVVTSEASYCRSLEIVVNHFVKSKQLGMLLTTQERNWLFSRLVDVRAISHSFLSKLEERVESDVMHFTVCDIISTQCPLFRKAYVPYLTNQSYQDATYQRLMNENPRFKMIVEKIERSSVCERLPLRSFLVLPFQRITRLKLLVQNIVKRTTPGTEEATQAIKALKHLEKIIQEGNDSITQMKSIESLVSLNSKVDFECRTLPLISQSRRLVREGPVTELMDFSLKDTERSVYLHLFTDYLLLSLPKEGGRFTVIDHCLVSELRVENCRVKLHSLQKNLFRLHMTQKSLLLRTDAQSDKLRWISALSRPHPEIDFSAAQDFEQMQCIRAFVAQQPDELSLEKAEVILVHQESSDHWVEGTRLSDRQRGWIPKSHLETIMSSRVKTRNLLDALKLTAAKAAV